jgi:hypothetical protein
MPPPLDRSHSMLCSCSRCRPDLREQRKWELILIMSALISLGMLLAAIFS